MRKRKSIFTSMIWMAIFLIAMPQSALAQYAPKSLNISGGLFLPSGLPVTSASVDFQLEIWDKGATCKLYEETHTAQNLSQTKGGFSLQLGQGTAATNFVSGGADLTWQVFANPGAPNTVVTGCVGGVLLLPGDERLIRVHYNLGSGMTAMTPDVPIESSAYAMIADTIQGRTLADLIVVRDDVGTDLTQSNVENVFSASNYAKLVQLLTNTLSASYSFNNQTITNVGTPSAGGDAVNKTYADSRLAGNLVNTTGVANGNTLIWNGSAWLVGTPSAIDATKLPLAGGTMTGPLTLQMTMLGRYNNAAEGALGLGAGDEGKIFYNTEVDALRVWNGASFIGFGATGVAGGDLTGTYPNPTINVGTVTTAKIATDAITSSKLDNAGMGINRIVVSDGVDPNLLRFKTCALNQILQWGATGWACVDVGAALPNTGIAAGMYGSSTTVSRIGLNAQGVVTSAANVAIDFPVVSVNGKTGVVVLNGADLGLGTASLEDVGNGANEVPMTDAGGKLNPSVIPTLGIGDISGAITSIVASSPITGGGTSGVVTIGLDASQVDAAMIRGNSILAGVPADNQVLTWNNSASRWEARTPGAGADNLGDHTATQNIELGAFWLSGDGQNEGVFVDGSGRVGIGTNTPNVNAIFDINGLAGLSALIVPRDSQAARPVGVNGMIRYNTNTAKMEVFENGGWTDVVQTPDGGILNLSGTNGALVSGPALTKTISIDTGVTAGQIVQVAAGDRLPVIDGSNLTNIANLRGVNVSTTAPTVGQVLRHNGSAWEAFTPVDNAGVTFVAMGSGMLGGNITSTGTLTLDVGTGPNQIVQLDGTSRLPAVNGSQLTNVNAVQIQSRNVAAGLPADNQVLTWNNAAARWEARTPIDGGITALSGDVTASGSGSVTATIRNDRITTAMMQSTGGGVNRLLITDGATGGAVTFADACADNEVLKWNTTLGWGCAADIDTDSGVVTLVGANGAVVTGPATVKTISIDTGVTNGQIVQVAAGDRLPVIDGSNLTNIANLRGVNVSTTAPTVGQVLRHNGSAWEAFTPVDNAGVTFVAMGSGMLGGNITSTGTLTLDVGTGPNQIVQLDGSSRIPAVNGSLLTNVNAVQIQSNNVASGVPADNQVLTWNASATRWEARAPGAGADNLGSHIAAQHIQLNGFFLSGDGGAEGVFVAGAGNVGVGTNTPNANSILDINGVGAMSAMIVPRDTQANRPTGVNGMIRYNNNTAKMEIFENGGWTDVVQTFTDTGIVTLTGENGLIVSGPATVKTLSIDTGVTAGQIVEVAAGDRLPVIDGSNLTNISNLRGVNVSTTTPTVGQVLRHNGSAWEAFTPVDNAGVTFVAMGSGLIGGNITATGTVTVDVGIGANQIPQLNASGFLGIGTATVTPGAVADFWGASNLDSAVVMPRATTANRPTTGVNGMIRYNTTLAKFEVYENGNWYNMATGTGADNLGNHTATTNLRMGANWISNDGDSEGIRIETNGNVGIGTSTANRNLDVTGGGNVEVWTYPGNASSFAQYSLLTAGASSTASYYQFNQNTSRVTLHSGYDFYLNSTGDQIFQTSSVERIRLTNNGRMGVGTTNPNAGSILDINGTGNLSSVLVPRGTTAERAATAANGMIRYNTNISRFEVYEAGQWASMATSATGGADNLGNHTATQNLRLGANWLNNDGDAGEGLRVETDGSIEVASNNSSVFRKVETEFVILPQYTNDTTGHVELQAWDNTGTTGARNLALQVAGGNVGIGTADPSFKLHLVGTNDSANVKFQTAGGYNHLLVEAGSVTTETRASATGGFGSFGTSTNHDFNLFTNNQTRMFITSSGNVGIGTTTPNAGAILDLNGTGNLSSVLVPRGSTAERAATAANGMLRYNTNLAAFEVYANNQWASLVTGSGGGLSFPLLANPIGSAGAPAYSFNADSDTGLYSPGANQVTLSTGGTGRLTVDAAGHVNIASVDQYLRINGDTMMRTVDHGGGDFFGSVFIGTRGNHSSFDLGSNSITAVGASAGLNVTTAAQSTFVGTSAGRQVTSGDSNTLLGHYAGWTVTTGSQNSVIGYASNISSGDRNVVMGYQSGLALSTGSDNVLIGNEIASGTAGALAGNTAVGHRAGNLMIGGGGDAAEQNILMGYQAGDNITTGDRNLIFGYDINAPSATASNQMSIGNLIFGTGVGTGTGTTISGGRIGIASNAPQAVLDVVGTGSASALIVPRDTTAARAGVGVNGMIRYNTNLAAFEVYANNQWATMATSATSGATDLNGLSDVVTDYAANNMFLGSGAGASITGGTGNVAIGESALTSGTNAFWNTVVGDGAGSNISGTQGNVVVGNSAYGGTGSGNVALGQLAMNWAGAGDDNVGIGYRANMRVTGGRNIAIGADSLYENTTGNDNVALGHFAGLGSSISARHRNVFLGASSGLNATTADNNILIGFQTGDNLTSGDGNLLIGYNIDAPSATGSSQMSIGNMIYGLNINGTGGLLSDGRIGIGTAAPNAAAVLDVVGTGNLSAMIVPRATTAERPVTAANGMIRYNTNLAAFEVYANNQWATVATGAGGGSQWSTVAGSEIHYSTANVGIGTDNPDSFLHVRGAAGGQVDGTVHAESTGWNAGLRAESLGHAIYAVSTGWPTINALSWGDGTAASLNRANGSDPVVTVDGGGLSGNLFEASPGWPAPASFVLKASGATGIGTSDTNVGVALDVVGTGNLSQMLVPRGTTAERAATAANGMIRYNTNLAAFEVYANNQWATVATGAGGGSQWSTVAGNEIHYSTANVGIGTTNPTQLLDVYNNANAGVELALRNPNSGANAAVGLNLYTDDGNVGWLAAGSSVYSPSTLRNRMTLQSANTANGINLISDGTSGDIRIYTNGNTNERMRIDSQGRVGIGATPNVGAILELNGTGNVSSMIVPRGTTAQRAVTPANGMIRYNTNTTAFEVYAGSWQTMATSSSGDNLGNHTATSAILAVTGTAATPSYTFANDPNTGLFSAGVDRLAFVTNGVERMRVANNGRVGIGTLTPASELHVRGTLTLQEAGQSASTYISTFSAGVGSGLINFEASGTNGVIAEFRDCCNGVFSIGETGVPSTFGYGLNILGSVGIGTEIPSGALHVRTVNSGTQTGAFIHNIRDSNSSHGLIVNNRRENTTANALDVQVNSISKFLVRGDGVVGIGTATPNAGAVLDLNGTGNLSSVLVPRGTTAERAATAANGMLRYNTNLAAFEVYANNQWATVATGSGGASQWNNGAASSINYTAGNVGVGTATPDFRFSVGDGSAIDGGIIAKGHGALGTGDTLTVTGTGKRMIWYPRKAAFRAGGINGTRTDAWDNANIGDYSTAFGVSAQAAGNNSFAVGEGSYANYDHSFAVGAFAASLADGSIALGPHAWTYGTNSLALGRDSQTVGSDSIAIGYNVQTGTGAADSSGNYSVAISAGNHTGARPYVSGNQSIGIFIGDQSGATITAANVMAILGGRVGVGTSSPNVGSIMDLNGTGNLSSLLVPRGTTAQRAVTPANGMIRYNTATSKFEVYAISWQDLAMGSGGGATNIDGLSDAVYNTTAASIYMGNSSGNNQNNNRVQNTALGHEALISMNDDNADRNTAFGYNALRANTSGHTNTAIGNVALRSNTTGYDNVAIGSEALQDNTTGTDNVAVGREAAVHNNGVRNVTIGKVAMYGSLGVDDAVAIGHAAMMSHSGAFNTALGSNALDAWGGAGGTGVENVAIGRSSIDNASLTSAARNTALGTRSLQLLTTGNDNIGLGYEAGDNITSGSRNIMIGYAIDAPSATASNQMSIGNMIFGLGMNGTGTTIASGRIGIGSASPSLGAVLDVVGTGNLTSMIIPRGTTAQRAATPINGMIRYNASRSKFEVYEISWKDMVASGGGSQWVDGAGGDIYYNGGSVGIGTNDPARKFTIRDTNTQTAADYYATSDTQVDVAPGAASSAYAYYAGFNRLHTSSSNIGGADLYGLNNDVHIYNGAGAIGTTYGAMNNVSNFAARTVTNATGTWSTVASDHASSIIGNGSGVYAAVNNTNGTITNARGIYVGPVQGTNRWSIYTEDVNAPSYFAGNVGIGSDAPADKLVVAGNVHISGGQAWSTRQTSSAGTPLTFNANLGNTMVWSNNGTSLVANVHHMKPGGSYQLVVAGTGTDAVTINCYSDAGSTALPSSFVPTNGVRVDGALDKTMYSMVSDGTNCLITWVTGF